MLVARAGLSPIMVGRAGELDRLKDLVTTGSGPRLALVSGEAGVGKTRLVQELIAGLPAGVPVLSAQAEQGAMGRPYLLLLEAVSPAVGGWARVPPGLRRWEDALGLLLQPIAPQLTTAMNDCSADELTRAGSELVGHLVGQGPAVVVFEDLHWADAESLGLFQRLAATPGLPALLVGSYRPEDLDRRHVTDLLAAIERQHQIEHVALGRLSVEDVRALVEAVRGGDVSYPAAANLHRRTAGNPFFLEELLVAAGGVEIDRVADLPLPTTLSEAVLRHLDGLEPDQRQVVDAAAILGQRIAFDLLASVTGFGENALVGVLRDLVGQGLVVEDDADVFSFRHALTREAVAGRLLGRERRRLHEKALTALQEAASDDWAALAFHAEGANRWDEVVAAARSGAAYYLRTGATFQSLRLAELGLAEADADLELLELATRAAWSVGLPGSALERAEQWRRLAESIDDPEALSRSLRVLARLRWEGGDGPGHQAMVAEAERNAERLAPGEERAWVANLLAESAMLAGRTDDAVSWADEALRLAAPSPSPTLRAAVLVNKGSALVASRHGQDEGEALLLEGASGAEAVGDYLSALRALNNLAHPAFRRWPPSESWALLERMGRLIERSGREDWRGSWHLLRSTYHAHVAGNMASAWAEVDRVDVVPAKGAWASVVRAELAIEAGNLELADAVLDEVRARTSDVAEMDDRVSAQGLRVRLAARRGDLSLVRATLDALSASVNELGAEGHGEYGDAWYHALVSAAHNGLPPDEVEERLGRVTAAADPDDGTADPAWPDHLRGVLAERRGHLAEAGRAYRAATTGEGSRRSPPSLADAHLGAARVAWAGGETDEARLHAQAADALLGDWPGWRQTEAAALLRRLNDTRLPPGGPAGLTARELEVVRLVAEGLSNGQIAARLFIATKTASVHVSNVLRKLALDSRRDVARWAVDQGLVDDPDR